MLFRSFSPQIYPLLEFHIAKKLDDSSVEKKDEKIENSSTDKHVNDQKTSMGSSTNGGPTPTKEEEEARMEGNDAAKRKKKNKSGIRRGKWHRKRKNTKERKRTKAEEEQ